MKKVLVEKSEWINGFVIQDDIHFVGSDEDIFKVVGEHEGWIEDCDEEEIEELKESLLEKLDYSDDKDRDHYTIETGGDWDDPYCYTWSLFTLEEFLAVQRTEIPNAQLLIDKATKGCL